MGHALHDLARHNSWANRHLLTFCKDLDEETLNQSIPGVYGTIIETLRHTIASEWSYLRRLTEAWDQPVWDYRELVGVETLLDRAAYLAQIWEEYLAPDEIDVDWLGEGRGDNETVYAVPATIFIAQAFHHGSEHRAQVCSILGAHGFEAPEVSVWLYAIETGRSWVKTPGSSEA